MKAEIYVGTSGWHYNDWNQSFYPPDIKGYEELRYHSTHFNTVENNSSFYRISKESTYQTWARMTPDNYKFSMKLNRLITHIQRLELDDEIKERIGYILDSTQVLKQQLGAIVIQLPASFHYDFEKLKTFLEYFRTQVDKHEYKFDIAIEFRNKYWFVENVYELLKAQNVALVAAQSSRYPSIRKLTADFAYIRLHGPGKLFASSYTEEDLQEWADYIQQILNKTKRIYVYFNNDYKAYAIDNAKTLQGIINNYG